MPAESPVRDGDAADFELIETLRWEPDTGFVRFERHLARLYASAHELGFACDPEKLGETLRNGVGARVPLRVRLTLRRNGESQCVTQPFKPATADAVWTLGIAKTRIASAEPLLRHKTTQRAVYDAARAEFSREAAHEVLLLNERDELCEGTITSLFVAVNDGPLLTPALACGLLPGILRQTLLLSGKAVEGIVRPDDLRKANAIFVGNSLRGLVRARLTDV